MIGIKLALLLAVLLAGLLGGAVPLRRRGAVGSGRFMSFGNALAAGIFLGAGLLHLLPDAVAAGDALGWDYPAAFLLATLGLVAMLLFEHVLLPEAAHEAVHAPSGERFAQLADARSALAAYAVLTALSVHSLLAGVALGAQTELAGALVLFLAIMAHKSTAGFALGVSLVRTGMAEARAWRLLGLFAVATPIGILLGLALEEASDGRVRLGIEACFLALAAGTFVYVATLDILRDELLEPGGRFAKWLVVCAGVGLMALLALWV